ncbi:MAG: type II toxin-antitoxin system VapC family toxin [Blastocatellia bacterium]
MDINHLPAGTNCLVDTNIFLYHLAAQSNDCRQFLTRLGRGEISACVTTSIIGEMLHKRMVIEAVNTGLISNSKPFEKLKRQPHLITQLSVYITEINHLLQLPVTVIEVTADDINWSHAVRRAYGLLVTDSLNLACAVRRGITDIVTHDTDFLHVPKLKIWQPTDI